ncbi:MAG: MMPL family transporter [Gammaproteobacteria bacterium]|nr:MMPL family transporter [Gammaproteobacteria bacterium]
MQRLLLLFAHRPWIWLAALLAASMLAATQLGQLQVRVSADDMLVADDPQRTFHEQVRAAFGEQEVVLLVVEDADPLAAERLERLRAVVDALAGLPFVAGVESLFSVPHIKSVDGYLDKQAYLTSPPTTAEQARQLRAAAAANPLLRNVLVAADGDAMAVAIVLRKGDRGVDDRAVSQRIDSTIAPLRALYERVYAIGYPQVRDEIAQRIFDEQRNLLPLAIGALLLALFLLLRQLLDVLTPLITAGVSILWTYGLMGWLGIPVNVLTSTVPILLIVVGSTEDIHLLAEFRRAQSRGEQTAAAIAHMARKMGRTVLLTFATTYVGFLSVGLSGIEALSQFGLIASTGLLFNFIVTVIFIPAALAIAGRWRLDGGRRAFENARADWPERLWRRLCAHRRHIAIGVSLLVLVAATGFPRIGINHNPTDSLGADSPAAADLAHLEQHFAGLESFSIVVSSGIQDTFLHARYLNEVVEIQRFVQQLEPSASVTTFADYLVLLNNAFLETDDAGMPQSNEEIAELMLFLDHARVSAYVTEDFSRTRIVVRHAITDAKRLRTVFGAIEEFIAENTDAGLAVRITGDSLLTLSATRSMIEGQLQSVLLILTFFVVVVSFFFTDLRVGLVAAVPNVFPIIMLFGLMGYSGIPLNIGTAMAAAIAVGIAVDDTLHFMLRYNQELRTSKSQRLAMHNTLREEALPVVSTSIALIAGFLVFTQSTFGPVAQFGLLSAFVIATALFADFVITPLLMSSLRLVTLWDLLTSRVRQQVIPQSPLFRDMRPWQIRKFVLSSTLLEFEPGEAVYRYGDDSAALYLVMKGVVEITVPRRSADGREPVVDQFGSGQIFGDVAVLADEPRKTNAVALTDTTLMVLSREAIANVTHFHPFIASKLFLNLARDVSCRWVSFIVRVRSPSGETTEEDRKA